MNILIADDEPASRQILVALVTKWGHQPVLAEDGRTALALLLDPGGPECALLDWEMPYMTGLEVCRAVRESRDEENGRRMRYRYIIVVTARTDRKDMAIGLEAGADDYIAKPVSMLELHARLSTAQRILALQSSLFATQEALRTQATRDQLTGAWNRPAGLTLLDRELARNKRDMRSTTVIIADVDRFKKVNDTWGHGGGDLVLAEVCRRIQTCLRREDIVCRYGGEEFLIILPGLAHAHAAMVAERILQTVRSESILVRPTSSIGVTISLGAHVSTAGSEPVAQIIESADQAMYAAKQAGRDRFVFFPQLEETDPALPPLKE